MEAFLGAPLPVFLGLTVGVLGGAAFLTGQSLGSGWRDSYQVVLYGLLLGFGDRFLMFALFDGELLALWGFAFHSLVLIAIGMFSYRLTLAYRMVTQYPWLYERSGPFSWREKPGARMG